MRDRVLARSFWIRVSPVFQPPAFINTGGMVLYLEKAAWVELRLRASSAVMTNPFSARSIAGWISRAKGSLAYLCSAKMPAMVPGTPDARWPFWLRSVRGLPAESRYISRVAAAGAFSRKSIAILVPAPLPDEEPVLALLFVPLLARYPTINPPPPIFPAAGYTTASAS